MVYLKVKIKSLAVEARIIRKEEQKPQNHEVREELHLHRTYDVRREARSALLAYACLRNMPYSRIEFAAISIPDWKRIERLIEKYGNKEASASYFQWLKEAKTYYASNKKTA